MRRDIIIVNDFYKNPDQIRDFALRQDYYYPYEHKSAVESGEVKATWMTSCFKNLKDCKFRSSKRLIKKLEHLTGEKIDRTYWNKDLAISDEKDVQYFHDKFRAITKVYEDRLLTEKEDQFSIPIKKIFANLPSLWNCRFQAKFSQKTMGDAPHNHIVDYFNPVREWGWNGIIYLNKDAPRNTGLHLWKHKYGHDIEYMTDTARWELIDTLGNVYNRLILTRGFQPHSGAHGFGDSIHNARLFQLFFFRTVKPRIIDNVNDRDVDLGI